ncbi:glycosyltransferase [Pelomonas aquatica]|jgi:glycosyltransferase involved in cell wall biosynthesis|uniref:Glycosyltransferase n=1 Tax=Pelomonas aquatica TaxID=431058 RepID=A0A9X4LH80_9BURK|nr:glycosyltransferase [Pelomonas aquatica]MCY4756195.1 glycosyltransferase [Pelomonas aquatica]MDG0863480.1 glycosyltransferase [Pelomonas aquatica]
MPPPFEPLTLVHVVFSSRLAGGELHCVDLANAQAALGHRVHVIGVAGSAVEGALAPAVRFHGLKLPLLRGWRVAALARRLGADVCHGHLGPACKAVAHARSAARVGTLHVGYKAHHHERLDGLVCVNRAQRESLPRTREGLARLIYNWAPERAASPATDLRAELGLAPGQLLVGSVGRLQQAKGMDLLVAGFKAHAPADAVLAILGEGPDRALLEQLAAGDPRVRLLGFRRDVDQALQAFDLFVSASREEAFPLAILEAMRAGRPVLATATQGPVEMLAGQPARLVPVGDADGLGRALAEEVARLRLLPQELRRVRYATAAYDRSHAVAKTLAFYRDVMLHRAAQAQRLEDEDEAFAG